MIHLASTSPRRIELLRAAGVDFDVVPTASEETMNPDFRPEVNAMVSGWQKARSAVCLGAAGLVLGCDTIVVAGNTHWVISGYGLIDTQQGINRADYVVSKVTVRPMTTQEIHALLDTGEYEGKSGAYMVQGSMRKFITEIEGPVDSIVGLPVEHIRSLVDEVYNGSASTIQNQGTSGRNETA